MQFEEKYYFNPIYRCFDNEIILKKFNGIVNYLNCTGNKNNIYYRQEYILNGKLCSRIIDEYNNIILDKYFDEKTEDIISYEDPRLINDDEISVIKTFCRKDKPICYKTIPVVYNIKNKKIYEYKLGRNDWEKNWIFYKDYIIYKINPYIVYNKSSELIYNIDTKFSYWKDLWGDVRLSCNPFIIDDKYYMLFHSRKNYGYLQHSSYINGLMLLNDKLVPIGYYKNPFNIDIMINNSTQLMKELYKWKEDNNYLPIHCKLHYFMNVDNDESNIYLYGGKNDCEAIKITISKEEFINKLKTQELIQL